MVPLRANLILRRNALWPMDDQSVARSAVAAGDLLRPLEGSIPSNSPSGGEVRIGRGVAQLVVMFQNILNRFVLAVEVGVLVVEAVHAALSARSVIAQDVKDKRIFELSGLADGIDQPPDLRVGMLAEPRIHFHLSSEKLLLIRG